MGRRVRDERSVLAKRKCENYGNTSSENIIPVTTLSQLPGGKPLLN